MPLDINMLRADRGGDPEKVRESQRRRFASVELVDQVIALDDAWRKLTGDIDKMKKNKNSVQKEVGAKKKAGEACDEMVAEVKSLGETIEQMEKQQEETKTQLDSLLGKIGNFVDDSVPISKDEDADNRVERKWGTPRDPAGLLNHHDLLWRIGGYEPERGVQVAGHRGYFLRDVGVMLNQAFINYGISFLRARNYCVLQPPYMMRKSVMAGVAQLEEFDEALYKVSGDGEDKYLIATSEQPICAYHKDEWMDEKQLPLRYAGVSSCFRKEAGAHGKDTWGIFRVHQFEKVEQFIICEGDLAVSNALQEEMITTAEEFYQSLGFPYHVINIVSGALNNAAIRKYDLECWFPGYNAYRELVSCSNCTDYQSRSMEIRCGNVKKMGDKEKKYVHMLNATLCATGRAICCLLETYQTPDGVRIPDVLIPFMGGLTFLPFVREARKDTPGLVKTENGGGSATTKPAAALAQAPASVEVSPEVAALAAQIATKGDKIRELKAAKVEKDVLQPHLDELLALKERHKALTGGSQGGGSTAASVPEQKQKKVTQAPVEEKKAPCRPPDVPILAPAYTSPAPAPRAKANSACVVSAADIGLSVWESSDSGKPVVDLQVLDVLLSDLSYVGGYAPSREDVRVLASIYENKTMTSASDFEAVKAWAATNPLKGLVNASRWLRNVVCFSPVEQASWK